MFKKFGKAIKSHKLTFLLVLGAIIAAGYFGYSMLGEPQYANGYEISEVEKGNIESLVSASGQVIDDSEVDVSAEVSAEVLEVNVSLGQEVKIGDQIAKLDSSDMSEQIYQAQLAVESVQLAKDKLYEPVDQSDITRAENEIATAKNDLTEIQLKQEHEMEGAEEDLEDAKENLDDLDPDDPSYEKDKLSYESQKNEAKRQIEEYEQNQPLEIQEAENNIKQKEEALEDLKKGPDQNDIDSADVSIAEKQSKLNDLYNDLSKYTLTAPVDGVIGQLNLTVGENVSSGGSSGSSSTTTSSAQAVIISDNKIAEVTVNEVDVPTLEVGQKVYVYFDAIEDLEITGQVHEIDEMSTVDSGVVYNTVKISFNSQDERIKNGMTVNVDIVTQSVEDVLVVQGSAISSSGEDDFVEIINPEVEGAVVSGRYIYNATPESVRVETGAADDLSVEILSGLETGDLIVIEELDMTEESEETETEATNSIIPMPGQGRNKQ